MRNRTIAFVLPQFHPIPENDKWWGKGFTEWTNVTKAKPLFKGHYQPRLPSDLGFYDLRLPEARKAQASIAKEHGIFGFCYYHYWFNGRRLLNQPIDEILRLKEPDMPFMLCWANENWTRSWDGRNEDILIKQEYNEDDDDIHMRWLCENVFCDARYICVDGCPVFMIYRQDLFPDVSRTAKMWRSIAKEYGFKGLYLCVVESFNNRVVPESINFDAAVEFAPHLLGQYVISKPERSVASFFSKTKKRDNYVLTSFAAAVEASLHRKNESYKLFRCVSPGWDNSARKKNFPVITTGNTPELYQEWLEGIFKHFQPYSKEENFVFINAMNEWAEGNHLEPCVKYGKAYLEATKNAIEANQH